MTAVMADAVPRTQLCNFRVFSPLASRNRERVVQSAYNTPPSSVVATKAVKNLDPS